MSEQILSKILEKLESMDNRLIRVEQDMVTKSDIEENTRILRALEHASQVNAAEMEGLKLSTVSKASFDQLQDHLDERLDAIQTDLSYILGKVAQHDRNIVKLNKIAK